MKLTRRQILEAFLFATAALPRKAAGATNTQAKRLIVFTLTGGASFQNAFLARRSSEVATPETLDVFGEDEVVEFSGSPLRAVRLSDATINSEGFMDPPLAIDRDAQVRFLEKHRTQLTVATVAAGSITHPIAQQRAMNGGGIWRGRTIAEAFAAGARSAEGVPLPNINMASAGFLQPGGDRTLPARARAETIAAPSTYFLGLHGSRGVAGAPDAALIALARRTRDELLEPSFVREHRDSRELAQWAAHRKRAVEELEALELITKLDFDAGQASAVRAAFPRWREDPLEAQAALAFLLLRHRVSVAVTIGPGYEPVLLPDGRIANPLVAFDSHGNNRPTQAAMWGRVLGIADRLIDLLSSTVIDDATGETLWHDTMIIFIGEFGRGTTRPNNSVVFGTPHHPQGAILVVSPRITGNRVLGGVDPQTLLTHGFDPRTGAPLPNTVIREGQIFGGILGALGLDISATNLPVVPVLSG
jgi:hypothetical protein